MAEKFVAHWFPKKHNMVLANFALCVGIYGVVKIASGNPEPAKPVKAVKVPKVAASASGYVEPSAENLDKWLENPKNIEQWEKSMSK